MTVCSQGLTVICVCLAQLWSQLAHHVPQTTKEPTIVAPITPGMHAGLPWALLDLAARGDATATAECLQPMMPLFKQALTHIIDAWLLKLQETRSPEADIMV
jgi:hypothetical protein